MKNIKLKIDGMHCEGCSGRVAKKLSELGCENVNVSHITGSAEFSAPDGISTEELCEAIAKMRFDARPEED